MKKILLAGVMAIAMAAPAFADNHALTDDEKSQIDAVMKALNCEGGKYEKEDDGYEIDDVQCADDVYDIKLNKEFKILEKEKD